MSDLIPSACWLLPKLYSYIAFSDHKRVDLMERSDKGHRTVNGEPLQFVPLQWLRAQCWADNNDDGDHPGKSSQPDRRMECPPTPQLGTINLPVEGSTNDEEVTIRSGNGEPIEENLLMESSTSTGGGWSMRAAYTVILLFKLFTGSCLVRVYCRGAMSCIIEWKLRRILESWNILWE